MTTTSAHREIETRHPPARKTVVTSLAGWSLRHPVIAIGSWLMLILVCIGGGNLVGMHKATDAQLTAGEAGRAAGWIQAAGLQSPDTESVLMTAMSGGRLDAAALGGATADLSAAITGLPMVATVGTAISSADHSALLVPITMVAGIDTVKPLLAAVTGVAAGHSTLRVELTGSRSINDDVNGQLAADFSSALVLSLPITIVILLVAFGALLAAGVPVLLGATSVLSAVGLYTVASQVIPDGGTAAEMILLIGMAVGVDYSLFYLKREREERRAGRTGRQALMISAATAGHAVVTSGCAVMVAMAGLFLLGDVNFASMAIGAIIVVALAVLGSLTVLPAVLGLLGERVDRPRIPVLSRLTMSSRSPRIWPALLRPALRFPAITLVMGVAGMLVLAWPATGLRLKNATDADLPLSLPSVAAYDRLSSAFPGQHSGLSIVATGDPAPVTVVARRIRTALAANSSTSASVELRSTGATSVVDVAVPYPDSSAAATAVLDTVRSTIVPQSLTGVSGVQVAVGGGIASEVDYLHELSRGAPLVIGFVLLMTFLLMTWTFSSVVVGLVTIFANLLSAAAAFGVLALVFQSRWGADLLGFRSTGAVIAWIPVFLFVILFGLSMDYHVLVVSRIKEATDRGLSIKDAVRDGVSASASVITSAAAVMIGVFAIFTGLHLVVFKELGLGLAAAVFLDAIVVRIMILPATMTLLGRANWWAPAVVQRRRALS